MREEKPTGLDGMLPTALLLDVSEHDTAVRGVLLAGCIWMEEL